MRYSAIGSAESRCAAFSILAHSLEDYVNEVAASNQGAKGRDVPKTVNHDFQHSIKTSIDYHDFMSDLHHKGGRTSYDRYHKVMSDTYRAMKKK